CIRVVERAGERLVPDQVLARQAPPESGVVLRSLGAQRLVLLDPGNRGLLAECVRRRKQPAFLQYRLDLSGHRSPSSRSSCARQARVLPSSTAGTLRGMPYDSLTPGSARAPCA